MCRIPFFLRNSLLVKVVPLSDTNTSGKPRDANVLRSNSIVAADVDELVACMSFHLE